MEELTTTAHLYTGEMLCWVQLYNVQYACKKFPKHSWLVTFAQICMATLDAVCWQGREADYPVCKMRASI